MKTGLIIGMAIVIVGIVAIIASNQGSTSNEAQMNSPTQTTSNYAQPIQTKPACDPSYPGVCIASYPPDLDCGEIPYKNFRVSGSDPHGFDRDRDGIGCES